jgi:transcription-repair coupling factor (superfamily II helicase)
MLAEAVEEEKAALEGREARHARTQAKIDLPVDAYLPDDYVPEEPQKLELYRRLGRAAAVGEVAAIEGELVDRFGALPPPVERLLDVARLRITAEEAGIASLAREGSELVVRFGPDWSRAATIRAMAPTGPGDRIPNVPTGGIAYGSNQMRVRVARDSAAAWQTTRAVVERLAARLETDLRPIG